MKTKSAAAKKIKKIKDVTNLKRCQQTSNSDITNLSQVICNLKFG